MANYDDSRKLYHKEVIIKQEGRKWVEYYAILSGTSWIFTGGIVKGQQKGLNNIETVKIEVTEDASCAYGDKTCYRFPFWVQMGNYKYNFKCETKIQRFRWMYAIRLCASRCPPQAIPNSVPPGGGIYPNRKASVSGGSARRPRLIKTQSCDIPSPSLESSDYSKIARCSKTDSILEETRGLAITNFFDENSGESSSLAASSPSKEIDDDIAKVKKDSVNKYPRIRSLRKSINLGVRDFLITRKTSNEESKSLERIGGTGDAENLSKSP